MQFYPFGCVVRENKSCEAADRTFARPMSNTKLIPKINIIFVTTYVVNTLHNHIELDENGAERKILSIVQFFFIILDQNLSAHNEK